MRRAPQGAAAGAGAVGIALLLAAAACGGSEGGASPDNTTRPVDTAEVESLLVATQRRASPDFQVGAASCPDRVAVSEGSTFECTVMVEGVPAPYLVTFADVNSRARTGRYDLRPAKAILSVPKLVDAIKAFSADPSGRVDCGPARVRVLDVGGTFDCQLIDGQRTRVVRVRVDDINGKVSFNEVA